MKINKVIVKTYLATLIILFSNACSEQKSQPYEETNQSISKTQEQGSIQTH